MKHLICNLKAHKNYQEIINYKNYLTNIHTDINLILAPPILYLNLFKDTNYLLCSQDIPLHEELNLTGDYTISQLKDLNVKYALIGHFERQKYYQENEQQILLKIKKALANNLKVIYCIGETKEELERKVEYQTIEKSLARILNNIPLEEFNNIIIAYEPTYLIGSKEDYNISKIVDTINFIKHLILSYYHTDIKIVFGGNINPENITNFLNIPNLDGFIVGNSSLNPQNIALILDKMTQLEK